MSLSEHGGNIYTFAKQKKILPSSVIDFSANINPMGTSSKGETAVMARRAEWMHYPDPNNEELYAAITKRYGIPSDNCVLGNGAAEIIYALCRLKSFDKIIVSAPTFSEYAHGAQSVGLPIEVVYQKRECQFIFDTATILNCSTKESLIFLGNPNNPDGSLITKEQCEELLTNIDKSSLLVLDESFIDFVGDEESCRPLLKKYDNLVILHSYTKFYAVPGLRLGAAYMCEALKRKMEVLLPAWSVSRPAQVYGATALLDYEYIENSRQLIRLEKERIYALYKTLALWNPIQPSVNFMLLQFNGTPEMASKMVRTLENKFILIRDCSSYNNLEGIWYRIAIKTPQLNTILYNCFLEEFE